jgi:hypothetical protein
MNRLLHDPAFWRGCRDGVVLAHRVGALPLAAICAYRELWLLAAMMAAAGLWAWVMRWPE